MFGALLARRGWWCGLTPIGVLWVVGLWGLGAFGEAGQGANEAATTLLVVVGAPGTDDYKEVFPEWAEGWKRAGEKSGTKVLMVGSEEEEGVTDRDRIKALLEGEAKEGAAELWVVLIGHGTFDGQEAKFNLRGPDVSAMDLAEWLKGFKRPVAVVDAASSSAPFINRLTGEGRVVVTATKSGFEQNYTRFGKYVSEALTDLEADLDKDEQVSLLEAYLIASRRVAEWYELEGRLATEHALLDDNGDGLGTPADWFRGIRAVKKAKDDALADGLRAHQFHLVRSEAELRMPAEVRGRRDRLELSLEKLRGSKAELGEEEYYRQLEMLLLEMGRLYEEGDGRKFEIRNPKS